MFTRSALLGVAGAALLALGSTPALASSWGFSFGFGHGGYYEPAPVVSYYDYPTVVYPYYAPSAVYYSAPAPVYWGGYYHGYHYRPVYRSYGYYGHYAPRYYGGHHGGGFYYRGGHHR